MRLINGDCLEAMDNLIADGVKVDAILTDPPYGTTACKWDSVIPFDEMWTRLKELRKEWTPVVLFGSEPFSSALRMSNIKEFKYDWIWEKNQATGGMNANKMPLFNYEVISVFYKKLPFYNPQFMDGKPYKIKRNKPSINSVYGKTGVKNGFTAENKGIRYPKRIIEFSVERGEHPTQKPVALLEYLIKTYTKEGDIVLDFTMGSGTTGVACKNLDRDFIGIELDDDYFNIAKKRIKETIPKLFY